MPKPLEIRIKLDRSQAKQATAEHIADANKMTAATTASVKAQGFVVKFALTEEQAMVLAKNRQVTASNDAKVASVVKALAKEEQANKSVGESIKGHALSIGKAALGYGTLENGAKILTTINGMWVAQRQDIEGSVQRIVDYQGKLLELASLKDKLGQPGPVLNEQLEFRSKTFQKADDAIKFQAGALNTGQASMGAGYIDKDQFTKLMEKAGKYQAASGSSPEAIGELVGILPAMIGKKDQKADEVYARMIGIFKTLQLGGSNLGPAVNAFKENAPLIGDGTFKSPEQLAAVTSAFSVGNSGKEATLVQQLIRAVVLGQIKQRKTGAEGSIASAEYLKSLGVTDQDDPVKIAQSIAGDIKKQQDALVGKKNADGTDKKLNIATYLATKGYEGEESNKPLMEFAKGVNSKQFAKTFEKRSTPESAPTPKEAAAETANFDNSAVAAGNKIELARDLADSSKAGQAETYFLDMKKLAFQTLKSDPTSGVSGEFEGYNNNFFWEGKVLDKANLMIAENAKKHGIEIPDDRGFVKRGIQGVLGDHFGIGAAIGAGSESGNLGGDFASRLTTWNQTRAQAYYGIGQKIQAAGGDPLDNSELRERQRLAAALEENNRQVAENNRLMREQGNKPAGAATPMPPSIVRPGPPPAVNGRGLPPNR